jgi:hypothetical protein
MPNNKNAQQQHQTMKKKLNQGQNTRKIQHLKKKKYRRHMKTISGQATREFSNSEMIQLVEDKTLSMSSPSFMKKKCFPLHTESNLDPTLFLTDYSKFSNKDLKEMLSTIIASDMDRNSWNKLLDTEETLIFIRRLTQLINQLNFFKLQDEQWTYYYNLGMNEGIWTGRVSKNMAIINSMCYTYGRSKILIEQRHKKYKKNLEQIQINIDEHMKQMPSSVDAIKLVAIITDLVYKEQYELRIELERRRDMLKFDAKDHQLVHTFYNLKPRQTEVE